MLEIHQELLDRGLPRGDAGGVRGEHCRLGGGDNRRTLVFDLPPLHIWSHGVASSFCLWCIAIIDHPMFDTTEETLDQFQKRVEAARFALPRKKKKKTTSQAPGSLLVSSHGVLTVGCGLSPIGRCEVVSRSSRGMGHSVRISPIAL